MVAVGKQKLRAWRRSRIPFCRKAEAPSLEEVSHSLFRECLVLEDVPEHFAAVTKRKGEVGAPGV
eukprot:1441137-Rhodomonas_salina.1